MNCDELRERLKGYEWKDFEVKEASWKVPKDAYETVSAFSNTEGGWLIFGVKQDKSKRQFEITGVIDFDQVQSDFITSLNSGGKFGHLIMPEAHVITTEDGKTVLAFYIPEADRKRKPIHIDGNIKNCFIRVGGSDLRCSENIIKKFIYDGSDDDYDGEAIDTSLESCFDLDALKWYRATFNGRNPGKDPSISNVEFLHQYALVVEKGNHLLPTRASLILFGNSSALLKILPRPVVDCQWIDAEWSDNLPEERWFDRAIIEENLIQSWRNLVNRYYRHSDKPFSIDFETLRRHDDPADYAAFREATINLLIHQDYRDYNQKSSIKFYRDRTIFWNPGDALPSTEELLEPKEKPVRNPRLVAAFRRIGLSDQAGTGVRVIFRSLQQLGRVPPIINNDKAGKSFELTLPKDQLLSEEQILFQAGLGVRLSDHEAAVFALLQREQRLRLIDVKAVTGLSTVQAQAVINRLSVQMLVEPVDDSQAYYVMAAHLRSRFQPTEFSDEATAEQGNLISDQPTTQPPSLISDQPQGLTELTEAHWKIVQFCDVPRSLSALMKELELTHRPYFKDNYLKPLLDGGILRMTYPDKPNHPRQSYVLTEAGVRLKVTLLQ